MKEANRIREILMSDFKEHKMKLDPTEWPEIYPG